MQDWITENRESILLWLFVGSIVSLALVAAHVATAMKVGGAGIGELRALATVPLYVAKKVTMLPALLRASRREQQWVRTARD